MRSQRLSRLSVRYQLSCCDLIFGGGDDLAVDVNLLPLGEELG
jgi:hypothetical protein